MKDQLHLVQPVQQKSNSVGPLIAQFPSVSSYVSHFRTLLEKEQNVVQSRMNSIKAAAFAGRAGSDDLLPVRPDRAGGPWRRHLDTEISRPRLRRIEALLDCDFIPRDHLEKIKLRRAVKHRASLVGVMVIMMATWVAMHQGEVRDRQRDDAGRVSSTGPDADILKITLSWERNHWRNPHLLSNKQLQDIQSLQQRCEYTDHLALKLNWGDITNPKATR